MLYFLLTLLLATPRLEISDAAQISQEPVWSFGILAGDVGSGGFLTHDRSQGAEIVVALGTNSGGSGNADAWMVLDHSATAGLTTAYVSPFELGLQQIVLGRPLQSTQDHFVLLYDHYLTGEVRVVEWDTRRQVASFPTSDTPESLQLADVDFDGVDEILVSGSSFFEVYEGNGVLAWSLGINFGLLAVGQMDADPALEAAGAYSVLDLGTRTIQWTLPSSADECRAADVDQDGLDELVVKSISGTIECYDVDQGALKWSLASGSPDTIQLADLDRDGVVELLVADSAANEVIVRDALSSQEQFRVPAAGGTIRALAAADLGTDGIEEILWTSDTNFSGGWDGVHVADSNTRTVIASSHDLRGPFVGAEFGDLDGDGAWELVTASRGTSSNQGGRILAFRWPSLELLAISDALVPIPESNGPMDLQLADVDGDGRDEVVIAMDWYRSGTFYNFTGRIAVFDFAAGVFTLSHLNRNPPDFTEFVAVDVGDVDLDGRLEIVAAGGGNNTGSNGAILAVYDAATGLEEWRSPPSGHWTGQYTAVRVANLDGDPALEICATNRNVNVSIYDGQTHVREGEVPGYFEDLDVIETIGGSVIAAIGEPAAIVAIAKPRGPFRRFGQIPCDPLAYTVHASVRPGTIWIGTAGPGHLELTSTATGSALWESATFGYRSPWDLANAPGRDDLLVVAGEYSLMLFSVH